MFGDFLRSLMDRHNLQINQLARMTNNKVSAGEISHCINGHFGFQSWFGDYRQDHAEGGEFPNLRLLREISRKNRQRR